MVTLELQNVVILRESVLLNHHLLSLFRLRPNLEDTKVAQMG